MMKETPHKKTILVIEDDPDVLSTVIKQLDYFGYKVITASDGMDGMKKVDAGGYDLVITDIVMPYISGVGVVTALKEKMPHIPVIAMTGYGKEPESAAMEQRADIVLAKPIKMSDLKEHIEELLSSKESQ
jgi:CheY-like chemotaxis protein